MSALELALAGERLRLLPERAVFLPAHATLLVADAHVGKAHSFRKLGVPVPSGTTGETLDALGRLVDARAARAGLALTLVRGNHDVRAGDPPAGLGIEVVDEPLTLGGLALCHHPSAVPGAYVLAGHWHPRTSVGGRARDRLRLPCYWFGDPSTRPVGVLPAFGSFTGMHPVERGVGDRLFVVAEGRVAELTVR